MPHPEPLLSLCELVYYIALAVRKEGMEAPPLPPDGTWVLDSLAAITPTDDHAPVTSSDAEFESTFGQYRDDPLTLSGVS